MTIALASAWQPRGELSRFKQLLPGLREYYTDLVLVLPPEADPGLIADLNRLASVKASLASHWPAGRYLALQQAFESGAGFIHYVDFDRLLHWVETRPTEWQQAVQALPACDCLVFGRTPAAYQTHPRALVETEQISNRVVSTLVGQAMDVSAGARGFSRRAAAFLVEPGRGLARPERALGSDAEWLVLLKKAGFALHYHTVDGLDWESADRFQAEAANPERQAAEAAAYDADPAHWKRRVDVAREIVEAGLDADQRLVKVSPAADGDCRSQAGLNSLI